MHVLATLIKDVQVTCCRQADLHVEEAVVSIQHRVALIVVHELQPGWFEVQQLHGPLGRCPSVHDHRKEDAAVAWSGGSAVAHYLHTQLSPILVAARPTTQLSTIPGNSHEQCTQHSIS